MKNWMPRYVYPDDAPPFLGEGNLAKDKYRRPDSIMTDPDAIVIGSGIGGMSIASILAQKKKWRVLLLEAAGQPGGATRCHEIDGFEFNTGIDSIGDMDPSTGRGVFRPTIDYVTGNKLMWAEMPDVHEVCVFGEDVYEWYSSPEKNIRWIRERFPGEGDPAKYYELEEAVEAAATAWGVTKVMPQWIPEWQRELVYRAVGGKWRKYMEMTAGEVFKNVLGFSDRLANVFTYMYGNHGCTPGEAPFAFHAANLIHYRDGAFYPVGGPGQIAECIIPIIEKAGGQLAVSSPVKRIIVQGDTAVGVDLESGERIHCPLIISGASAYTTFMELLDTAVSERFGYPERMKGVEPSPAHLYLFLGYDEAIDLPKQIFWHMPTYDGDLYDLASADIRYKGEALFEGMGGYLLSPSARDPVYASRYPNKSTVIVLAESTAEWVDKYRTDAAFKKRFDREVGKNLLRIVHRHMPQLRDKKPAFEKVGVPMGCNVRAWGGCSLGLNATMDRFNKHTHWLRPITKIKQLFLVGQDAFSAGFCGSMFSARLTYTAITNDFWFSMKKNI